MDKSHLCYSLSPTSSRRDKSWKCRELSQKTKKGLSLQCEYCGRRAQHIKEHMRFPSGEKPFKCDQCVFSCTEANNLKKQLRKHTKEKSFKCDQCNYSTKHSSALKTHKLVHTGEKPYVCEHCNKSFIQTSHLQNHMRKIHSAKANVNMKNSGKYWQTISNSVSNHYIINSALTYHYC